MMPRLLISELLTENVRDPLNCVEVTSDVRAGANRRASYTWDGLGVLSLLLSNVQLMQIQNPAVMSVDLVLSWCKEDIGVELRADKVHIKDVPQNAIDTQTIRTF